MALAAASATPAWPAAQTPPQPAPAAAGSSTGGGEKDLAAAVAAEKAAAAAMLADPEKAADAYFSDLSSALAAAGPGELSPGLQELAAAAAAPVRMARLRRNFRRSLRQIAALNAASGDDLAFGVTPFAHLSDREFERAVLRPRPRAGGAKGAAATTVAAGTGRPPGRFKYFGSSFCPAFVEWADTSIARAPPPGRVDWRTSSPPLVTPVKAQGACGSCAAFANAAAIEAAFILKHAADGSTAAGASLSVQDSLECMPGDQCKGVPFGFEYIDRAACFNVSLASDRPYRGRDTNQCDPSVPRRPAGVEAYTLVPGDADSVRRAVAYGVVSVALGVRPSMRFYRRGVIGCNSNKARPWGFNHASAIVGYETPTSGAPAAGASESPGAAPANAPAAGDASSATPVLSSGGTGGGGGAAAAEAAAQPAASSGKTGSQQPVPYFILKNSWGTRWGQEGYFFVQANCPPGGGALNMFADEYMTLPIRDGTI